PTPLLCATPPRPRTSPLSLHDALPICDHAIVVALYRDDPRLLPAGHRSQAAHADDTRTGGSAPDSHHGRIEALPVSHPVALHRVCGKPAQWEAKDRAGYARDDQLLRMDRSAAVHAA